MLDGRVQQMPVDDGETVEPGDGGQAPGDRSRRQTLVFFHGAGTQLEMWTASVEHGQVMLGAPGEPAAQVGTVAAAGVATVAGQKPATASSASSNSGGGDATISARKDASLIVRTSQIPGDSSCQRTFRSLRPLVHLPAITGPPRRRSYTTPTTRTTGAMRVRKHGGVGCAEAIHHDKYEC